jgi:hypothetical protein
MRSIASAIYFLSLAVGGFSPYLVGWMNEWFAIPAPYQDSSGDTEAYDPTYSMLIMVAGMYFISSITFACAAVSIQKRYFKLQKSVLTAEIANPHYDSVEKPQDI